MYTCIPAFLDFLPIQVTTEQSRVPVLYSRFSLVTLCVFVLVTQSCLSLCDPMGCSPPGSPVHGILQARKLEWVAIRFFRDVPDPEMEPRSSALQADSLPLSHQGSPDMYTLLHIKQITNENLLHMYSTENSTLCFVVA